MWLHLVTGNHDEAGVASLADMIEWLIAGLTEVGHEVTVGSQVAPSAINILWENFKAPDEAAFIENEFKFGLIATEIPTGDTFNWRDAPYWRERRRTFDRIAPRASFIWSTVKSTLAQYALFAPSSYLELGYSEALVDPVFQTPPTADFGFYGVINEYRAGVLAKLRECCEVIVPDNFLSPREVNPFLANFRVGVCFKQSGEWPILSPTRVGRLLHARRGVAAEYVPIPTRQASFIPAAEPDEDFNDFCLRVLEGWRPRAEEAFDRFRLEMPMSRIVERMIDETITANPRLGGGHSRGSHDDGSRLKIGFSPVAVLVEQRGAYNILKADEGYLAVSKKVGSVKLFGELLGSRPLGEVILADPTLQGIQVQVDEIEARQRPATVKLVEETEAFNIVVVGERYAALAKTIGEVALLREPLGEREVGEEIMLDTDLISLRERVRDVERRRGVSTVRFVCETPTYNIIESEGAVLALSKQLGPTMPFHERLGEREITDLVMRDTSLAQLCRRIAQVEAAGAVAIVTLVEETAAYNIVDCGQGFVAIAKRLGPTALFAEVLGARDIDELILTGKDLKAVRAKAIAAEEKSARPAVALVGETSRYNIVSAGDQFVALAKSLGESSLFDERLGERELGDLLLKDRDLKKLKARVKAAEGTGWTTRNKV